MQRAMARYLTREMAVLGVVEFALSFAVIYAAIQAAGVSAALPTVIELPPRGDIALAAVLTLIIGGVALTIGLYSPEICFNRKRLLIATGLTTIISFAILLFVCAGPRDSATTGPAIYIAEVLAAWLAMMTLIRLAYGFAISRAALTRRVLLLGHPRQVGAFSARLRSCYGRRFDPVELPDQTVSWSLLRQQRIWGVVVISEPEGQDLDSLLDCKLRGVQVLGVNAFHEICLGRIDLDALTKNEVLLSPDFASGEFSGALKRLCDVAVGTCMLALLLPLMAITAAAVRIDSPGPVFYRQQRVGRFDKPRMRRQTVGRAGHKSRIRA